MTRGELLRRASSRELTDWQYYEAVEPFPAERTEIMLAQIAQTVANANRDPKKRSEPFTLADFLILREPPAPPTPDEVAEKIARTLGGAG